MYCNDLGVSIVIGVPQARWMASFMENPIKMDEIPQKWMVSFMENPSINGKSI